MSVLSHPRHPLVVAALRDAAALYGDHQIEGRPALAHSAAVAAELVEQVPDVAVDLVCAAVLHDSPEFAPAGVDVPVFLDGRYGAETCRVVMALAEEHKALDQPDPPVETGDYAVLLLSTVDKLVAFRSNVRRAEVSGDAPAFFGAKVALENLMDYFRRYHEAGVGRVPVSLSEAYGEVIEQVEKGFAAFRARAMV